MRSLQSLFSRRRFLAGGSSLSAIVGLGNNQEFARAGSLVSGTTKGPNVYDRLGVRTRVNAKGVYTGRFVPDIDNHVPHLFLQWDERSKGLTKEQLAQELREGDPSIECLPDEYPQGFSLTPYMLRPGEEMIVGRRLAEILREAQNRPSA